MIYINWTKNEKPNKSKIDDKEYYLNRDYSRDNINLNNNIRKNNKESNNREKNNKENNNRENNNRENNNTRLNERDLISNNISNPFLMENDYIMDIKAQDEFLRPQSSN